MITSHESGPQSAPADRYGTAIHPDNLLWLIVGDRSKIEPGILSLRFAPTLQLLDPDGNPIGK